MKRFNFKKLENQILSTFILLIIIVCVVLFSVSSYISRKSMINTIETILPNVAKQSAIAIENNVNIRLDTLKTLAQNEKLQSENTILEEKIKILLEEKNRNEHLSMSIIDIYGQYTDTSGKNYDVKNTPYFKDGMLGKCTVSDPMIIDDNIVFVYRVPIIKDKKVIGILTATRDENELNKYIDNIKVGETGEAFIINKEGTAIAHKDRDLVIRKDNNFENIKNNSKLKDLVQIQEKMVDGKEGIGEYKYGEKKKYIAYAPIKPVEWSIGVVITSNEITNQLIKLTKYIGMASLMGIVIAIIFAKIIVKSINNPIINSVESLKAIAAGNLKGNDLKHFYNRKDELGVMAKSIEVMKESVINMLNAIKTSSYNVEIQTNSLEDVSKELKTSSENIYHATNEVAKGTVNQSQDLIYITNTLKGFSLKLNEIVNIIKELGKNTNNIKDMSDYSNSDMKNVIISVKNVNSAFNQLISKIKTVESNVIKINEITNLINDISEQTNLLALNAAIEAARAGDAGKGFNVLANEIRNLAEQSKNSSIEISNLISSISVDTDLMINTTKTMHIELENQENDIDKAIKSFETITIAVSEIAPKMVVTTKSVEDLNSSKDDITNKIESASSAAQEVSAAAEQIAASTEEMNKYAETLANLVQTLNKMSLSMMENVNKFKI